MPAARLRAKTPKVIFFRSCRIVTWSVQKLTTAMPAAASSDQRVRVSGRSAGMTRFRQPKSVVAWNIDASHRQRISTRSKTMSSVETMAQAVSRITNQPLAASNVVDFQ
jgi:hypothetical protein